MKKKRHGISDMIHRVAICTAKDVVVSGASIELSRELAFDTWAAITPHRGSMFGKDGSAIKEDRERQSHVIKIRYRDDREISASAWIYEQRLKSSPRWFKILDVKDVDEVQRYWEFSVRLVDRSDNTIAPSNSPAVPLPEGVKL